MAFLLCQDDLEVEYFLQQLLLLVSMADQAQHTTTMISEWMRRNGTRNYSGKLIVEALCTAHCNHVLLNLGLDVDKLSLFYYPTRPEITTNTHPILKLLYLMCEKLTVSDTTALLQKLRTRYPSTLELLEPGMLEIHLLHLISQKKLRVFEDTNLDLLMSTFKEMDNLDVYDFLKSNIERIKVNQQSLIVGDKQATERATSSTNLQSSSHTIPSSSSSNDSYTMNCSSPGVLLIINQFKFHADPDPSVSYMLPAKPLDDRKGTEKDVEALLKTFKQFNFQIILRHDLRHDEILNEIKKAIEGMKSSDSSLFVAILSHGIEGCVYGSNSVPLEVREIKNQLYQGGQNPLLGRPKCLIIQACQGNELQISRQVHHLQTDSPSAPFSPQTIPPCSDFLIAWSTVEGYASLRHILTGTWFVQTLCQTIDECFET